MTIDLNKLKAEKAILPPRIVLYGPPKIGKTTFAASIPDNIILDVEGGSGAVNVKRIDKEHLGTYDEFMGALGMLYQQDHKLGAVTVDSVDWLEQLIFTQAAKEHGKTSIADVGYGAGYATAQNLWKEVLEGLDALRRDKGMMTLMIAHEQIKTYNNPLTESYDRYNLKLRSNDKGSSSESIIKEWSDLIGFINKETFVRKEKTGMKEVKKAATSERVFIHTQESPAYLAGNRYGLPAMIDFTWEALSDALAKAMV